MEDINDDICEWLQAFGIIVVWNVDFVKLCKLSFVLNNPNTLKNSVPSYRENLEHAWKIWIEFGQPSPELGQDKKKTQSYKVWIFENHFHTKSMLHVCLRCWEWSNMFYWFCAELRGVPDNYVHSLVGWQMYVNPIPFEHVLWRVEGNFVDVGVGKDIGWVQQITFKTTACGKVNI
jgi:hypothetical protein